MLLPELTSRVAAVDDGVEVVQRPGSETALSGIDTHGHVFTRALPMIESRRYTPTYDACIDAYLAMLDGNDVSHGVLVQPSFLGVDNGYLLEALRRAPARLRGVAMVAPDVGVEELQAFDRLGVVGVRLNLIGLPDPDLEDASWQGHLRRLAGLGWLVEVQAEARRLPLLLPPLLATGSRVLIDHFGRPNPALGVEDPGFRYLLALGGSGQVWVKLSGAYRNGVAKPGERVAAAAAACLLRAFGPTRLVWGSDWPHTGFEQLGRPDASRRALDRWVPSEAERHAVLIDTPRALFRFDAEACPEA